MMIKFGKFLASYHQKCIAHALQLAIMDVFYKKNTLEEEPSSANIPEVLEVEDDSNDEDIPLSVLAQRTYQVHTASENDSEDDDDGAEFLTSTVPTTETSEQRFEYYDLIAKVKKVVKIFRKSPTKNDDILQKYVVEEFGKEYVLTCDSITRWSSLATTLERFLQLRNCIEKALIDVKVHIHFSENEWTDIGQLHEVLDIIKTVLEALCRRDATLLTADVAIKYTLNKLNDINSFLRRKMASALKKRYSERRLIEATILNYLHNPEEYFLNINSDDTSIFIRPNSDQMCNQIVSLLKRSNCPTSTETPQASSHSIQLEEQHEPEVQRRDLTKSDELINMELQKIRKERVRSTHNDSLDQNVKIEMALFENGGDRGRYLTKAYEHLLTIPPTSVEPERIFSSAGLFCNKIRSRLGDATLDALIFLKTHYQENKKV